MHIFPVFLFTFVSVAFASNNPNYKKQPAPTDITYKAGYGKNLIFEGNVGKKVVFEKKVGDNVKFSKNIEDNVVFKGTIGNDVTFNLNIRKETVVTRNIPDRSNIQTMDQLTEEEKKEEGQKGQAKFLKKQGKVDFKAKAGTDITFHEDVGSITFNKAVGDKVNFKGKIGKDVIIDVEIPSNMQTRKELADNAHIKDVKDLALTGNGAVPAHYFGKCMGSLVLLAAIAAVLF